MKRGSFRERAHEFARMDTNEARGEVIRNDTILFRFQFAPIRGRSSRMIRVSSASIRGSFLLLRLSHVAQGRELLSPGSDCRRVYCCRQDLLAGVGFELGDAVAVEEAGSAVVVEGGIGAAAVDAERVRL